MTDSLLAPYAVSDDNSRGRAAAEPAPASRSEFQRDRDRVIHCTAFRRLEYKTQVFVNHEGDLFRTRLTHSIEVAQIARSLARALKLNEDLVEAISLSHDLGHTPFGHAGQDALNDCMKDSGGFEHNLQSLRIVDVLEERYAEFEGLNLTFETREGILKHCSLKNAALLGDVGQRFLDKTQPSLEAQLCNLADAVAYNNHDVDDGLRAGLITFEQLQQVEAFSRHSAALQTQYPGLAGRRLIHETVRRMINDFALDLIEQTRQNILFAGVETIADVRAAQPLVAFSAAMREELLQLQRFLRENLYWHYQVLREMSKAKRTITELFDAFTSDVRLLPPKFQQRAREDKARAIADYIAGMTDRYAMKEHQRLFAIG
ncbi:MAG: dgt1 [Rhodocyclales bacterium]|nr:dgt1 [Rhodocyclales bacterium]